MRLFLMGAGSVVGCALGRALAQAFPQGYYTFADEGRTVSASRRLAALSPFGPAAEVAWTSRALGESLLAEAEVVILVPDLHRDPPEILQGTTAFALRALSMNRPLVLWSDSLVYGWSLLLPCEDAPLAPSTPGLAALVACEQAVLHLARLYQVPAWVLRAPWLYGEEELDRSLPWQGASPHTPVLLECLHVEDAARYLERFLSTEAPSGIYNLGPGEYVSDNALAQLASARRFGPEAARLLPARCLRASNSSRFQDRADPLPPRRHSLESYLAPKSPPYVYV